MNERSCVNCRFWGDGRRRPADWMPADCRRHAPIAILVRCDAETRWPSTRGTDFCGDFEPFVAAKDERE